MSSQVPGDLKYAKSHEWVRVSGDTATVGITDHAQHELTDVVFVERLEFPYALLGRRGVFAQFREVAFIEKSNPPRVEFRW